MSSEQAERPAFIDHLTLTVHDAEACKRFYRACLAPWHSHEIEYEDGSVFGPEGSEDIAIRAGEPTSGPIHLAFAAPDRATVDAFYEAGLQAGGRDNGSPGLRPHYHAGYYAAFLIDPAGNNVEAVYHGRPV